MTKTKFDPPTQTFPYKISRRLNVMSVPRPVFIITNEDMPPVTDSGVRRSALRAPPVERVFEAAWPYTRRLLLLKRMYRKKFSEDRLAKIDRMIELSNATPYSKLANCVLDLRKQDANKNTSREKKGWSDSDWKKHMDYISQIAGPRKDFKVDPPRRGETCKLSLLLPRINTLSTMPEFKVYRRPSQESNYRAPGKVPPNALKYVISDRVKKLAKPKIIPMAE